MDGYYPIIQMIILCYVIWIKSMFLDPLTNSEKQLSVMRIISNSDFNDAKLLIFSHRKPMFPNNLFIFNKEKPLALIYVMSARGNQVVFIFLLFTLMLQVLLRSMPSCL